MRILFLLPCLEPAGSETYCLSLATAWRDRHEIFWISDKLHHGQRYQGMPIHMKAFPMGLVNAWRVASFIKTHRIDIVHSHSRRAHWVAAQAAKLTRVRHVTTIHQPLPVHFFSKTFPCLGDQTIGIDEAVVDHLRQHFSPGAKRIHLIRNGIDLRQWVPTQRHMPTVKQILVIGRLSGGRWKAFLTFLETLERHVSMLPPAHYKIVGRVPLQHKDELTRRLSMIRSKIAPSFIESIGYVQDLELLVRNSDGAIAAGRSALESMAQGRPVILMGEGGILGLFKPDIWAQALRTNLGDHMEPQDFNTSKLERGLREMLNLRMDQQEIGRNSRSFVEQYYDVQQMAPQVEAVYHQAMG